MLVQKWDGIIFEVKPVSSVGCNDERAVVALLEKYI